LPWDLRHHSLGFDIEAEMQNAADIADMTTSVPSCCSEGGSYVLTHQSLGGDIVAEGGKNTDVAAASTTAPSCSSEDGSSAPSPTEGDEVDSDVTLTQVSHASSADLIATEDGSAPRKPQPRRRKLGREPSTPQKPRRAKSAYAFFCAEERPKVLDEIRTRVTEGRLNLGEISKDLSERWSHLDAAARTCYEDLATNERLAREASQKPKRPLCAYLLFLQDPVRRAQAEEELKAEGKEAVFGAMGTKLGQMWQVATLELKAELTSWHEKSMLQYKENLARWQAATSADTECGHGKRKAGRAALETESTAGTDGSAPVPKRRNATSQALEGTPPDAASPQGPRKRLVRRKSLTTMEVDAATLAEAQRLDLEVPLLELANSSQILEAGINVNIEAIAAEMLSSLLKANGLVDEAERSILQRVQQRSAEEAEGGSGNQAQEEVCA